MNILPIVNSLIQNGCHKPIYADKRFFFFLAKMQMHRKYRFLAFTLLFLVESPLLGVLSQDFNVTDIFMIY